MRKFAGVNDAAGGGFGVTIRNRIKELREVKASDLIANPKNWRRHPKAQAEALRGLLGEIGYADALLARELADGRLMLIDGHLRAEITPNMMLPVLVLDLTDVEADKLLLTLDPLAGLAQTDSERIKELLATVETDSEAVGALLEIIADQAGVELTQPEQLADPQPKIDQAFESPAKMGYPIKPALADRPASPALRGLARPISRGMANEWWPRIFQDDLVRSALRH
jgi:hypothetical protein